MGGVRCRRGAAGVWLGHDYRQGCDCRQGCDYGCGCGRSVEGGGHEDLIVRFRTGVLKFPSTK